MTAVLVIGYIVNTCSESVKSIFLLDCVLDIFTQTIDLLSEYTWECVGIIRHLREV